MSKVITLLLFVALLCLQNQAKAQRSNFGECLSQGYELGTFAAEQFCSTLEMSYLKGEEVKTAAQSTGERLCHAAGVIACRAGLRVGVSLRNVEGSLCKRLIETDWQGAAQKFRNFFDVACAR